MLIVISGPSGTGKTTIYKRLFEEVEGLWFSISWTTRPPREGEINNKEYHFVSMEEFMEKKASNEFVEWTKICDDYYATPKEPLEKALSEGRDCLLEIDVYGGVEIKKRYPDAILIFILPPSTEALEDRLRNRKTELEEVIQKRLMTAKEELKYQSNYDYRIINNEIDVVVKEIKLIIKAYQYGQEHIFRWYNELSEGERANLINQVATIDFNLLKGFIAHKSPTSQKIKHFLPPKIIPLTKDDSLSQEAGVFVGGGTHPLPPGDVAKQIGEEVLRANKLACFMAAGGEATRLGTNIVKGMFPIGPVTDNSLFEWHAEKIVALQKRYECQIPFYIMTSDATDMMTKRFFKQSNFFDLNEKNVRFIKQRMVPSLNFKRQLILDAKDHLAMNPDGHGGALFAMKDSGALDEMKDLGIEYIFYFQVDNPLVKVGDCIFIGYHILEGAEISVKVVSKRHPKEKVGVVGYINNRLGVIEYSELSKEEMHEKMADGSLRFNAGNTAIHILNVTFVERLTEKGIINLPYHPTHKKIPYLNEAGQLIFPAEPNGIKFETFILDALGEAKTVAVVEVKRSEEFAPLKNKEGEDSSAEVKQSISDFYGKWLESANIFIPRNVQGHVTEPIEISPLFALDEETFVTIHRNYRLGLNRRKGME